MNSPTITTFQFHSAGEVIFGVNCLRSLEDVTARLKTKRLFVITDKTIAALELMDYFRGVLSEAGLLVHVFDGAEPEPSLDSIHRSIKIGRQFSPDTILGFGGGSVMDTAKLTATALQHGGNLRQYVGENHIPGPVLPLICIPTTAGTGSEVSQAAVFTDVENQVKVSVLSNFLRPNAAIVDPLLTIPCPPTVTADSGMDALCHAIEAYTAIPYPRYPLPNGEKSVYQGKNPFADLFAEKAIRLIGKSLVEAVTNGNNLDARTDMALAATMGGLAFSNAGVALVHAMEYPLGGFVHCSHGRGNGMLLEHVMRYNLSTNEQAFAQIAEWLGEKTTGLGVAEAAQLSIKSVSRLRENVGMPARLRDLGVNEEMIPVMAEKAASITRLMRVNPRSPQVQEILEIYKTAY